MKAPAISNDEALARLRHELDHPPYHQAVLRPEPVRVDLEAGLVEIRLPYRPDFRRAADAGDIHGGVIASLIDLAAHASVAVQTGRMAPTIDLRIDYLRGAPGNDLIATARTLRVGRTIARADVEITSAAQPGVLIAVGRGTFSTYQPSAATKD